jgi:hypothetical protein
MIDVPVKERTARLIEWCQKYRSLLRLKSVDKPINPTPLEKALPYELIDMLLYDIILSLKSVRDEKTFKLTMPKVAFDLSVVVTRLGIL